MVESRWLRWIGPGVVALGAVGFIASTTLGAGVRPWTPRACAGPPPERTAAAREPGPASLGDLAATPWFRLDPVADAAGDLAGQQLAVGLDGDPIAQVTDLPVEAFAAGPFGRLVLVGSDDGKASHLEAFDVANGCSWTIAEERDVIRRATVDPTGTSVYEMRVDRASRADLGIWLRPMDGRTHARRVLGSIDVDPTFGRTWSTEFAWSLAGDRLAVQSCGEAACRTRIIVPSGAVAATLDAPDLGLLIGLDGDRVVTYASCRGLPCPVVATDLRTGARQVLVAEAGAAGLVDTPDGARLVHEQRTAAGRGLRSVPLDGRPAVDLGSLPDDLGLEPTPAAAAAATRLPPGWVLLAPDGRLPVDPSAPRPKLRHLPDGTTVPLDEVAR
jgi:hypothetical protein